VLDTPSIASPFVSEILMRLQEEETVLKRLMSMRGKKLPPLASLELRNEIRNVIKSHQSEGNERRNLLGKFLEFFRKGGL